MGSRRQGILEEQIPRLDTAALAVVKVRIEEMFLRMCMEGVPSQRLPDGMYACGQYLSLPDRDQRGLHGTAAALRVLGDSHLREAREVVVPGLIRYLEHRRTVEASLISTAYQAAELRNRLDLDAVNTIKTAEILYALSFVKAGVAPAGNLVSEYAERLLAGRLSENGWGYFLDHRTTKPELLATAHSVRALSRHGYDVARQADYLWSSLKNPARSGESPYVDTFCLLVLSELSGMNRRELRRGFRRLWEFLHSGLSVNVEANIDFVGGMTDRQHFYVRVPWQLHLIAIASVLEPWNPLITYRCQHKLVEIANEVQGGLFIYPHSGTYASTRTHAIIYDTLDTVAREQQAASLVLSSLSAMGRISVLTDNRWIRVMAAIAAIVLSGLSAVEWATSSTASLRDLAPEVVGAILLWAVALLRGR